MHKSLCSLRLPGPSMPMALVGLALLGLAVLGCASSVAQAPTPERVPITPAPLPTAVTAYPDPKLGDCFGGILSSADALHCYVLENALREGLIDVEEVYDADGVLYFSLRQDRPIDIEVSLYLRDRANEFVERWPHLVPYNRWYWVCMRDREFTYRQCLLDTPGWEGRSLLPKSMDYVNIRFHMGGEEARRQKRGWASWRRVWPEGKGGGGIVPYAPGVPFDVSDVDVTNIPKVDCTRALGAGGGCGKWTQFPDLGVAGRHDWPGTIYYQIKDPPTDPAELEALKEKLFPGQGRTGQYTETVDGDTWIGYRDTVINVVIIPVKYDYGELWRWAEILDRFTLSAGNTVGITAAIVDDNRQQGRDAVWPLKDLVPAGEDEYDYIPSEIRETVMVVANDPQRAAAALPDLLPRLGIPVYAVGVIKRSEGRSPGMYLP